MPLAPPSRDLVPPPQPLAQAWLGAWNIAGGLSYHLAAWRWRRRLWAPYTAQVAAFLQAWAPVERELVVIGPSAGWHLPGEFLQRFEKVWAIEPDPVARWLLRRRFPGVRWQMVTDDYFTPAGPLPWSDNLARLFADFPTQALFFSDFLGQLIGLYPDAVAHVPAGELLPTRAFLRWQAGLRGHLRGRTWASTHDRFFGHAPPAFQTLDLAAQQPTTDLQRLAWPDQPPGYDMLTDGLDDGPRRLLVWHRKPATWHVMEALARRA